MAEAAFGIRNKNKALYLERCRAFMLAGMLRRLLSKHSQKFIKAVLCVSEK